MAFIQDDPKDQEKEQVAGMNVAAGGTAPSEVPQGPSQTSAGQGGAAAPQQAQTAQQGSQGPSQAPKSGMFSSVKKYIQANKPAAQQMAGAATQKTGQQAQQIGAAAEQKRSALQGQIQANQQKIGQQVGQAQQAITGIMGDQFQAPTAEQAQQFQQVAQGQFQGLQATPTDINLAQQQARAKAIQGLAGSSQTEAGRSQLLQQTFGQGPQQYTRGQSSLDTAILGADAGAQQQLTQQLGQQAQQAQQAVQSAKLGAQADVGAAQLQAQQAPKDIKAAYDAALGQDQFTGLGDRISGIKDMDTQLQGLRSGGEEIAQRYSKGLMDEISTAQSDIEQMQHYLSSLPQTSESRANLQDKIAQQQARIGQLQQESSSKVGGYIKQKQADLDTKQTTYQGHIDELSRYLESGDTNAMFKKLADLKYNQGIDVAPGHYSSSGRQAIQTLSGQIAGLPAQQKSLADELSRYQDYTTRRKLTPQIQEGLQATQGNLSKYEALKQLMGGQSEFNMGALADKYLKQSEEEAAKKAIAGSSDISTGRRAV